MTQEQRIIFMYNYGVFYAALGGTFGAYRTAGEAFEKARVFPMYARLNITDADFFDFTTGFNTFQDLRTACQLEQKRAEGENAAILREIGYESPNHLYGGDHPVPVKTHCKKCLNKLSDCKCRGKKTSD